MTRNVFCDNPWGLSTREAECVWLLQKHQHGDIAERLCVAKGTVSTRLTRAYLAMDVTHAAAAAVEFDRWWQGHKRNVDDATVLRFEVELLSPRR